ncbi:MAG: peptidase T, partial [Chloroflexota bacterium]|nr:peptidase T [Chloroflexota bacterium]
MTDFASALETRFVRYARIDTQSDESSSTVPSTARQLDLLNLLKQELEDIGAHDVRLTGNGFVIATIPATVEAVEVPRVAFLAHVDTAPAFNGTGVKPIVHRNYDGSPIVLPDAPSQVLSPEVNPYLQQKIGDDIVTASGTTLLGADDKAGVAIIMTMAAHLLAHPGIPHGEIRICFTPDEEIGRGIDHLDLHDLAADYAYTLDGAEVGELTYETFSADKAVVTVTGVSTHTGTAFGRMVNALHLAARIVDTLPQHTRTPETTTGREGFIHVYQMEGTAAEARLSFLLRDFDLDGLAGHGELVRTVCAAVQATEPRARIECTITPQYRNMRYWLEQDMRPVD